METVRIDSSSIAKFILDLNREVFKEDYVSPEEVYEARIIVQSKLNAKNIDIAISEGVDGRVFETKNRLYFYIGDITGIRIDAYYMGTKDFANYYSTLVFSREEILESISKIRLSKIEKLNDYIAKYQLMK